MTVETCHDCMYAYADRGFWLRSLLSGFPIRPICANQPDAVGQLRETPIGRVCRNFRARPTHPEGHPVKRIGLGDGHYALVDSADYDALKDYHWHLCGGGYAARSKKGKRILMHRQIMKPPKGMIVDHIDGHRANNCRSNLRVCTVAQNQRNQRKKRGSTSIYKGVSYLKNAKRCHAKLVYEGQCVWLGHFDSEVEAARAYDRKAIELFGEFARPNFPEEWPPEKRAEFLAQIRAGKRNVKSRQ